MFRSSQFPNLFHSDRWKINFSNIPTLDSTRDMRLYDNFVKGVGFPNYLMGEIDSYFKGFKIRHPDGGYKANYDLQPLSIEFKLSEDMLNYIFLFEWMRSMKYGETNHFTNQNEMFRKNGIQSITINILDNQKREIADWKFTQCFLLSMSGFPLIFGASEEITFICDFSYEEIKYETKKVK